MEEDLMSKYTRLTGRIFLVFIVFIITVALVLLALRFIFGLLNDIPWFSLMYAMLIVLGPGIFFITVYLIYYRRTLSHPSKATRIASYIIFSVALLAWLTCLYWDIGLFIKYRSIEIGHYNSYDILFLGLNIACIFLTGVMQALSTEKEKDWMEKNRSRQQ